MEFHPALVLLRETASMIKTARTTISRIMATGNSRWNSIRNSTKATKRPNGKINGNPIGII
jgi:hypothetical protein